MVVFGKQPEDKFQKVAVELIKNVNDSVKRLRILEQSITTLEMRANSLEINNANNYKALQKAIADVETGFSGQEERLERIDATMREVVKQMKTLASKSDFLEVKELVSIFNPIKSSFVTRDDVERIIDEHKNSRV